MNNPLSYTDPSGLCVPYIEVGCVPFWETGDGLNWADGQAYVQTAILDPLTGFIQPTWDVITDQPGARATVRNGVSQLFNHPLDSTVLIVESYVAPFKDIYEGIVSRNPDQVGRGFTGFVIVLGGARLARNPSIGLRNIHGGRTTVGGQIIADCVASARELAQAHHLPTTPPNAFGHFIGRPGLFNPMWRRFGASGGDVPAHAAMKTVSGTIVDRTIMKNITDYGSLPDHLVRYQKFDTFTPHVYNQLLDAFYTNWKSKQVTTRSPRPSEMMNWE